MMDEVQTEQVQRRTVTVFDVEDVSAASPYKMISIVLFAFVIILVIILVLKSIF